MLSILVDAIIDCLIIDLRLNYFAASLVVDFTNLYIGFINLFTRGFLLNMLSRSALGFRLHEGWIFICCICTIAWATSSLISFSDRTFFIRAFFLILVLGRFSTRFLQKQLQGFNLTIWGCRGLSSSGNRCFISKLLFFWILLTIGLFIIRT